MSAESLILACKVTFSEYGLPKRIMSDAGGNFISDTFRQFYKYMTIEQVMSLSYHHQSNCQVEACIKFVKNTMLQIGATPLEPGLLSPATLLFNHPRQGIMLIIKRIPVKSDNDEDHYEALVKRQTRNDKNYDTARSYDLFSIGSTVAVQ